MNMETEAEVFYRNYHTHTQWCNHGTIDAEETICEAISLGMQELGFSEHAPFPDNRFGRMAFSELINYIGQVRLLQKKYAPYIKIFAGLEIEYFDDDLPYYHQLYRDYGVDYLILGQHYFKDQNSGYYVKTKRIEDEKTIAKYFDSLIRAAQSGLFPMIAHPDYCFGCDLVYTHITEQAICKFLSSISSVNTVLEINANGFRKPTFLSKIGERRKYPAALFWKYVKEYGLLGMIGSDCHHRGQLYDSAVWQALCFADDEGIMLKVSIHIESKR